MGLAQRLRERTFYKLSNVEKLFKESINNFTPKMRAKYVSHCEAFVKKALEAEGLHHEDVEQFIIILGLDDEDNMYNDCDSGSKEGDVHDLQCHFLVTY